MTQSKAQKAAKAAAATQAAEAAEATSQETPAQGSPADLAPLEPPTDEPTDGAVNANEPTEEEAKEDASADEPAAPQIAAPVSVVLDAPPAPAEPTADEEEPGAISANDAAAKKLELNKHASVTDTMGNLVDPDEAFTEANASGQVQCRVRLIEHAIATEHRRPVKTLLLARDAFVTNMAAEVIKTRLRQVAAAAAEQD